MERAFLMIGAVLGALAVGLGAFGAHGLEALLEGTPDAAKRLGWWTTAVSYHLPHAVVLVLVSQLAARRAGRALALAGGAFLVGVIFFSGTLYAMSLGAPRWLGAVTPLGGLSLIFGWLALAAAALKRATIRS